jgi:putative FmdB family regulatory protein
MPLYIYRCIECGTEFEALAGRDQAIRPCPRCGRDAPRLPYCRNVALVGETVAKT